MTSSTIARLLDDLDEGAARETLSRCNGSSRWVEGMLARRPFDSDDAVHEAADAVWSEATRADVLEALSHHPQIGADIESLREKYASTATWSEGEQSGVKAASDETLLALREGNRHYQERFGHIFVVCASGKSADEMLALLESRMAHDPDQEIAIAAEEQRKITHLRLEKLA